MITNLEKYKEDIDLKLQSFNKKLFRLTKKNLLEIDQIIDNCISFGLTELLIKYLLFKSAYYSINNNFEKSLEISDEAIQLSSKYNNKRLLAASYNRAGANCWNNGLYDNSIEFFLKSHALYKELEMNYEDCSLIKNIGMAYLRKEDAQFAYKHLFEAYQLSIKLNFRDIAADCLSWLGILENDLSNFEKGIEFIVQANHIYLDLNNVKDYATNLNSIGLTYIRMKNYIKALEYINEAEKHALQQNNSNLLADVKHNLALIHKDKQEYDKAIKLYNESINLRLKTGDPNKLSRSYNNLGNLYYFMNDYQNSLIYYKKALNIRQKVKLNKQSAITHIAMAKSYLGLKKYRKALNTANLALNMSVEYNDSRILSSIYGFFYNYYQEKKKFKRALEFFNLMNTEHEKVFNENSKHNIMNIEKKYEIDKLQKKIQEENEQEQLNATLAMAVTANHQINQPLMLLQGNIDLLKVLLEKQPNSQSCIICLNHIEQFIDEIDNVLTKFREGTGFTLKTLPGSEPESFNNKSL